jgi:hypothetical protein
MITGARAFVFYSENPLKGCLAAGDLTNSVGMFFLRANVHSLQLIWI